MSAGDDIDARYRAKLDARANGTTPVFVSEPLWMMTTDTDDSVDGRYRRKLLARSVQQAAAVEDDSSAPSGGSAESAGDKPKGDKPKGDKPKGDKR